MLTTISHIFLWILVLLLGTCTFVLVHKVYNLHKIAGLGATSAIDRLPRGSIAPSFEATDARSGKLVDSSEWEGGESVLLFVSTGCSNCIRIIHGLVDEVNLLGLVIVVTGAKRALSGMIPSGLAKNVPVLISDKEGAMLQYEIPFTPVAVLLDSQARIRSYRYPTNSEHIFEYLNIAKREATDQKTSTDRLGPSLASAGGE